MNIDAKTRTCGLIGYPVGHSVSPVIHNTLAQLYHQNLVYVPLPTTPGKLEQAIAGADAFDFLGMNVTVPYKSQVLPYLKEIDPLAEQIGAVNTLVRVAEGYKGYNTDMPGLYRAMLSDGVEVEDQDVLILGAGGVARAVAFMLLKYQAKSVVILNRTLEKAQQVAEEVNTAAGFTFATALSITDYQKLPNGKKYLAIQATNVGMSPNTDQAVVEDPLFYQKLHTGYDLIFNPMETKFMKLVKEAGGRSYHGLKMLLYQGIIAYELWNQVEISAEHEELIYRKMKEALGV